MSGRALGSLARFLRGGRAGGPIARNVTSAGCDGPLTMMQAQELTLRLTLEDRKTLLDALHEFESKKIKDEYEGQLAAHRWRSKFGRPSKVPKIGDVDPTGTYCLVPDDWLERKQAKATVPPTTRQQCHLMVANAIPFIGFGFLDNFIMITAGEWIDNTLGYMVNISTMAAAALGNTISDVAGIGSAFYVERFAEKTGFESPKLTPLQLDTLPARRASNFGRVLGITMGCLLGMIPLAFMKDKKTKAAYDPADSVDAVGPSEVEIIIETEPPQAPSTRIRGNLFSHKDEKIAYNPEEIFAADVFIEAVPAGVELEIFTPEYGYLPDIDYNPAF